MDSAQPETTHLEDHYPAEDQIKNLFEAWEKGGRDALREAIQNQQEQAEKR